MSYISKSIIEERCSHMKFVNDAWKHDIYLINVVGIKSKSGPMAHETYSYVYIQNNMYL